MRPILPAAFVSPGEWNVSRVTRNSRPLPSREAILALYDFDPEAGKFYHRHTRGRAKAGAEAGTISNLYRKISVGGVQHYAHRLIPLMLGFEVPDLVDHIDRDRVNNAPINLRPADRRLNGLNAGVRKNNTSGHVGVSWNPRRRLWQAYIADRPRHKLSLGYYPTRQQAAAARRDAELRLCVRGAA